MVTPEDQSFLRRALRLAMNGRGHVEPNPMVGCVLVKNKQIVGEGWHQKVGEAHAEPNALADCKSRGNDPAGATAYVTLEPCCHTNKRTPPCAPRLIEANVARVVVGCLDPNPDVNGRGVAMLRAAGIVVDILSDSLSPVPGGEGWGEGVTTGGALHARGRRATTPSPPPSPPGTGERGLNASHFRQLIAPFAGVGMATGNDTYLTLKWAEDVDGVVAGPRGVRAQISNAASSRLVHQLRARSAAVVVGINTVLRDDPMLDVRGLPGSRQPLRVVLDHLLKLPAASKLVGTARDPTRGGVAVICSEIAYFESPRVAELQALGVRVSEQRSLETRLAIDMDVVFHGEHLPHREFLVEPGPTLARALLPDADRVWILRSPTKIGGGPSAPRAAEIPDHYVVTGSLHLAGDTLTEYLNTRSPAFFAATPSADFVLAQEGATP